jgi:hypothetical protein
MLALAVLLYGVRVRLLPFYKRWYIFSTIGLCGVKIPQAKALLYRVMQQGRRLEPSPDLESIKQHFQIEFKRLPVKFRVLSDPVCYPVKVSRKLRKIQPD